MLEATDGSETWWGNMLVLCKEGTLVATVDESDVLLVKKLLLK